MNDLKPNDLLQTPQYIIDDLGPFDLDPCAGEHTKIGSLENWWIGRGEDGLKKRWFGFVYCNPPFSQKDLWIQKMIEHGNGILILPERGSAPWFGPLSMAADAHFIMGKKINFIGGPSSNNVGSSLFLFGDEAIYRIGMTLLPGHLNKVQFFNPR